MGAQQQVNLKTFLDLAARIVHAHPDKDEDEAVYEAFRFVCSAFVRLLALPCVQSPVLCSLSVDLYPLSRANVVFVFYSVFDRQGTGYIPAREFCTFGKILGEPFSEKERLC